MMSMLENLEIINCNNKEYYLWFDDKECTIGLSQIPRVRELLINKTLMTKEEIKEIKRKPFILNNTIDVLLKDKRKNKIYFFTINQSYRYDGASIPKFARFIIGDKKDTRFVIGSLIHDVLCENHHYVDNDRYFASKVLDKCILVSGTCPMVRFLIFHCCDNYQKFCSWS